MWNESTAYSHAIAAPAAKTTAASSAATEASTPLGVSNDPKSGNYDEQKQDHFYECSSQGNNL